MRTTAPADLQRWSEELARNPASLSFLPLARAYRRQGRNDLARTLCMRGLEQHPTHVEAHALLALLHLESGDHAKAADEWSVVLRLKPGNFEALRGMGFRYLEQGNMAKARQHLERAELIRPGEPAVQEALRVLRDRQEAEGKSSAETAPPSPNVPASPAAPRRFEMDAPPSAAPAPAAVRPSAARPPVQASPPPRSVPTPRPASSPAPPWAAVPAGPPPDPSRIFDSLLQTGPVLGALLLDTNGLVLAGTLTPGTGEAEGLGAIIGGAIAEAARTAEHLSLGEWRGILMETATAVLHVSPLGTEGIVVIAAKREAPTGWVMRSAGHAATLARQFMEAYA